VKLKNKWGTVPATGKGDDLILGDNIYKYLGVWIDEDAISY